MGRLREIAIKFRSRSIEISFTRQSHISLAENIESALGKQDVMTLNRKTSLARSTDRIAASGNALAPILGHRTIRVSYKRSRSAI